MARIRQIKMIMKQKSVHLSSPTRTVAQKEENSRFREFIEKIGGGGGIWAPTQNSRLCEKHFLPHDFQGDRQDKTRSRQKKRGELKKKT